MDTQTTLKLIEELSKRIDVIEGVQYKFWITVGVSILAILGSFYVIFQNKKQSKALVLQAIKSNIDLAKSQIESLSMELAPLKAKKSPSADEKQELDIKNQVYESALERLLNAYNDGCDKFYKKQISAQDFTDMYHQDIRTYIESFPDKFREPLTRFDKMLQYYNEYHKNIRA